MAIYRYEAYDASGRLHRGTLDEETRRAALERLRAQGLVPVRLEAERARRERTRGGWPGWRRQRVPLREVAVFTRQLATLLSAGLPLVEALSATIDEVDESQLRTVVVGVRDAVNEGRAFAEALARYPGAFGDLYVNMVRAGEASGTLEIVLERLAEFLEGQMELRNKITGALAYPMVMFFAMVGVVGVLFVYVIPKLVQVFEQTGQLLPLPTRILIATAQFVRANGLWVVVGVVLLIWAVRRLVATPRGRAWWDRVRIRLPIVGPVARHVIFSRFARTLATLLASGVQLPVSLQIVREVVGNTLYAEAIDRVRETVIEGGGLAAPLRRTELFPGALVRMVAAGEQSGELEQMLQRVADAYDREVEVRLTVATRLLEPVMILVMAGLVFFIMLSILIPMFKINQLVG